MFQPGKNYFRLLRREGLLEQDKTREPEESTNNPPTTLLIIFLNTVIVILLLVIGYFSYAFISKQIDEPSKSGANAIPTIKRVIQLDVLNGSGVKGVASRFTAFLRSGGFDVVEMRNYKTSDVRETIVVDRVGNLETARRVATALGVNKKNVIQQINNDYFVDVSVIIGKDYSELLPAQ